MKQTEFRCVPGKIYVFLCVLSTAVLRVITWFVLYDGNTLPVTALLMAVLGDHVQLTDLVLNNQGKDTKIQIQ